MMTYQFYDLRAFADVIYAADKDSFLEKLTRHLKQALLIYEDNKDSDEQRRLDFKLTLLMVSFSVNAPLLRQKQENIRLYEEKNCSWKRFFRLSFWRGTSFFPVKGGRLNGKSIPT